MQIGDTVGRIWGDGFMTSYMRVSAIDEHFIYCDAQKRNPDDEWVVLPEGSSPWKFGRNYGLETDEEMGWGLPIPDDPEGALLCISRLVLK